MNLDAVVASSLDTFVTFLKNSSNPLDKSAEISKAAENFATARWTALQEWFRAAPAGVYITGSYGRLQPTPYSDLDLVLRVPNQRALQGIESWVEEKIYPLYKLFPKVTHAFRFDDQEDVVTKTDFRIFFSLREAKDLFTQKPWVARAAVPTEVKEALVRHLKQRWDRYAHSPCLVELNLKESPGALLDHMNYLRLFPKAELQNQIENLFAVRAHLQAQHGKAFDTSSHTYLRSLPKVAVAKIFMSTVNAYRLWVEELDAKVSVPYVKDLDQWLELSHLSKKIFSYAYVSGSFESVFPQSHQQLFNCSDSATHVYTVGWHSSEAVKVAKDVISEVLQPVPFMLEEALVEIDRAELLFLAVFLHDMGKGQVEDHCVSGARWARERVQGNLPEEDVDLIEWLIVNHLELHRRSMKEDIFDPVVIARSAEWVRNPRYLSYLYLLTIVDLVSTNRKLWNTWRAQVMGNYFSSLRRELREEVTVTAELPTSFPQELRALVQHLPNEYRLSRDLDSMALDLEMLQEAETEGTAVHIHHDRSVGFDVLTLALGKDVFGVLSSVIDTLFQHRVGVWRTRTYKYKNEILDLIWIYPYDGIESRLRPARLKALIKAVNAKLPLLATEKSGSRQPEISKLEESLEKVIGRRPRVPFNEATQTWELQVSCPDREGLLRDLVRTFFECGFNVEQATIGTTGDQAVDYFVLS